MNRRYALNSRSGAGRVGVLLTVAVLVFSLLGAPGCKIASEWIPQPPPLTYVAGWNAPMRVPGSEVTYVIEAENGRKLTGVIYMVSDYGNAPARHRCHPIHEGKCVVERAVDRRWVAGTHFSPGLLQKHHIGLSLRPPDTTSLFVVVDGFMPANVYQRPLRIPVAENRYEYQVSMVPASPSEERNWLRKVLHATTVHGLEIGKDREVALAMRHRLWARWIELVGK